MLKTLKIGLKKTQLKVTDNKNSIKVLQVQQLQIKNKLETNTKAIQQNNKVINDNKKDILINTKNIDVNRKAIVKEEKARIAGDKATLEEANKNAKEIADAQIEKHKDDTVGFGTKLLDSIMSILDGLEEGFAGVWKMIWSIIEPLIIPVLAGLAVVIIIYLLIKNPKLLFRCCCCCCIVVYRVFKPDPKKVQAAKEKIERKQRETRMMTMLNIPTKPSDKQLLGEIIHAYLTKKEGPSSGLLQRATTTENNGSAHVNPTFLEQTTL